MSQSPRRRNSPRLSPLAIALLLATSALATPGYAQTAAADAPAATDLDQILVIGQRAERSSTGATNLDLSIKETPQSISVVSDAQMQRFGATSVNDALRLATGVRVDEWETNRTTYSARGFDILNTQIDGVGLPNGWGIATGASEAFGYEKVEVIRGANGLLTGVGNAAGTINYVRKRPTNERQGLFGLGVGSWNMKRVELDYSSPLTDDGRWAGRVVAAHEDGDSYLRANTNTRDFVYGVVDGQVGDNGTIAVGYSWQRADSDGIMWGALPFTYRDGTQGRWDRSTSTTQDWTYWDTETQAGFVDYSHRLGDDWQLKLAYNYRHATGDEKMFYAFFGYDPAGLGLIPGSHLGLAGFPWAGSDTATAHLGSATLSGRFEAFGREHEAMFGLSQARSETRNVEQAALPGSAAGGPLPAFPYASDALPEPAWGAPSEYSVLNQRLRRAYAAARIALGDRLKAIVGANYAHYRRDGRSYALDFDQTTSHTSPYAGLTFDFNERVLGYVSYSDIYQPQDQVDANDRYLDPSQGVNLEAGLKADWLDGRLLTTLAVFKADQDGLATPTGEYNEFGSTIYAPVDVSSKGIELEAVGRLGEHLDLVAGYTALKLSGQDGDGTYPWVPRRSANLQLSGRLPAYTALSWGIGGRWQSGISNVESSGFRVRQDSYTVLNAFAAWDFLPNATLQANIDNLGDATYINTLRYSGYYGAPRHYSVSLKWRF